MTFFVLFPAIFCPLVLVANGQYVFPDKAALQTGVAAWIADETAATATYGGINTWDVSGVTSMQYMFYNAPSFNGDISGWDVSGVTSMSQMFSGASAFNGDISSWDVSGVKSMHSMFKFASAFNQQLCWDLTGKSTTNMFEGTSGAVAIDCPPTNEPTGQPTDQPTDQPSNQPTKDTSFKKHFKDELDGIASNVKDNLVYAQSGLIDLMTKFKRAVEPSRIKREEM